MDGFHIESDGGFMFATANTGDDGALTYTVKSRVNADAAVHIRHTQYIADLAGFAQSFMLAGPDVTRFRIVMDDYTLVGVRNHPTFTMIGVDGFTGRVERCEADISGEHFVNVIAVVMLAIAGDDLDDSRSEDFYPLADLICGTWVSKPYP
jgi:hypothetical protein